MERGERKTEKKERGNDRKMRGRRRRREGVLTMIYLHSLVHYSSHPLHDIYFFCGYIYSFLATIIISEALTVSTTGSDVIP